ncbi:MAG: hypothetical protein ACOCWI_01200, partial [Bacillota bacterium]
MDRACGKRFLILLFIVSVILVFVIGQINNHTVTYAFTDGEWDDFASAQLSLQDSNLPNSETNPYLIESANDLAYLSLSVNNGDYFEGVYFLQTADIDLNDHFFTPIGYGENNEFRGIYDGGSNNIDNLIIDFPQDFLPTGLFGNASYDAVLKNIIINSGEITANTNIGSIAGNFTGSLIENCISRANIYEGEGTVHTLGGIAGFNYGKIDRSYFEGNIYASSGYNIGGIAGTNGIETMQINYDYGVIEHSFNAGDIESYTYVGGIAGENYGLIKNIYNAGYIESQSHTGGIVGYNAGNVESGYNTIVPDTFVSFNGTIIGQNTGSAERLYFNIDTANESYNIGALGQDGEGINNAENDSENEVMPLNYYLMVGEDSLMDLDDLQWEYIESSKDIGYTPYLSHFSEDIKSHSQIQLFGGDKDNPDWGKPAQPYLINTAYQFVFLSINVNDNEISYSNSSFEIINDIDFSFLDFYEIEYQPIGKETNPFAGDLEGNFHTLENLILDSTEDYTALFAFNNAQIHNLTIDSFDITGNNHVGALVAINHNDIENIELIHCKVEGNDNIGGLVGENLSGDMENIVSESDNIIYGDENIGGFIGKNSSNGSLFADLYNYSTVEGKKSVGGIIGISNDYLSISNSFFTGNIEGEENVGGIMGLSTQTSINSSFVHTDVITGLENVAGFVGKATDQVTIDICYVNSDINAQNNVAGFVGLSSHVVNADNSFFAGGISFDTNGASISNSPINLSEVYYNNDLIFSDDLSYNGEGKNTVELTNTVDLGSSFTNEEHQGLYGYYPQITYHINNNQLFSEQSATVYYFDDGDGSEETTAYEISESIHLF